MALGMNTILNYVFLPYTIAASLQMSDEPKNSVIKRVCRKWQERERPCQKERDTTLNSTQLDKGLWLSDYTRYKGYDEREEHP